MKKKVFDIAPPQRKNGISIPSASQTPFRSSDGKKRNLTMVVLAVFLLAFGVSYFQFQRAEVVVIPETESVSLIEDLVLSDESSEFDLVGRTIPSFAYEITHEATDSFEATGRVAKRAEGMIRVFNNFSVNPQTLVATTRFVSADGKLFRTPERVVIPGARQEGDRLVPGEAEIRVVADQPGQEYNIEPSTFSIPGFLGTARYTAIYAKSFLPMEGGGNVPQVTQDDILRAQASLEEKAKKEGMQRLLQERVPDGVIIVQNVPDPETENLQTEVSSGDEVPRFEASLAIRMEVLGVKESHLEDIARSTIPLHVPDGHVAVEENTSFSWNVREGNVLELLIKGISYPEIDFEAVKGEIAGLTKSEAESVLSEVSSVKEAKVELWPLWTQHVPSNPDRVEISVRVSEDAIDE